jgi:hypothetical protein
MDHVDAPALCRLKALVLTLVAVSGALTAVAAAGLL